ncbi:MAG TPA: hypothetical protein VKT80_07310, partial [Chloroflexota bacterium]|nr:hypothetical protein [Chloroflexota bacterium]
MSQLELRAPARVPDEILTETDATQGSLLRVTIARLWMSGGARIGLTILAVFVLMSFLAPVLMPYVLATDG